MYSVQVLLALIMPCNQVEMSAGVTQTYTIPPFLTVFGYLSSYLSLTSLKFVGLLAHF